MSEDWREAAPSVAQVLHCQLHSWYDRHRRWTIPSAIIDLSPAFVSYLNADGFFLPPGIDLHLKPKRRYDDDSSSSESDWSSSSASEPEKVPNFEEIEQIREKIAELGGAVIPKLNWSAPKDATWIACTSSLKCVSPGDVLLLLKASEFIQHDLTQP